jgi:hypothetical protein
MVSLLAKLLRHKDGSFVTFVADHSQGHEWDEESNMVCGDCDWVDRAGSFRKIR